MITFSLKVYYALSYFMDFVSFCSFNSCFIDQNYIFALNNKTKRYAVRKKTD